MAKTDIIMPQMGESIAEGTVVRWLKRVGDPVRRDEPLFEISTDKVDAEIPSPCAGVLVEIRVPEGQTVEVNTVVGAIAASMEEAATGAPGRRGAGEEKVAAEARPAVPAPAAATAPAPAVPSPSGVETKEELRRLRSTPLVRRMAAEHGIDITRLVGTGISGRVTKEDLRRYVEAGGPAAAPAPPPAVPAAPGTPAPAAGAAPPLQAPVFQPGESVHLEPMSVMRRKIAEHMVASKRTSAHVHTVYEIDCTNVLSTRAAVQPEFVARHGAKLTVTPFFVKAAVEALRAFPIVNASVDGDNIAYKRDINIGVAVALDWGLIVPVIKHADELSLVGLNNRVADLASRARNKQLAPDDVQGGTFPITNPGIFGSLFGLPIIPQPQVAILGMGMIEKRVRVLNDAIAIRPTMYCSLGYDHRLIDGAVADQFMSHLKKTLETADFKALL